MRVFLLVCRQIQLGALRLGWTLCSSCLPFLCRSMLSREVRCQRARVASCLTSKRSGRLSSICLQLLCCRLLTPLAALPC